MCGRDLLRLPGVNPGQHCNGLQTATHLTDGQKVLKNQSLAAEAFHPPAALPAYSSSLTFNFSDQSRSFYL